MSAHPKGSASGHQQAKVAMLKLSRGEQVTAAELVNIRGCLVYSAMCLEGLDPQRFTIPNVCATIDRALAATVVSVVISEAKEEAA
jgi:hypothetical protein